MIHHREIPTLERQYCALTALPWVHIIENLTNHHSLLPVMRDA